MISVRGLSKSFKLHQQGGVELPVLRNVSLEVKAGECVALDGPSGSGKSTLLKCLYGNYRASAGSVRIGDVDLATAKSQEVLGSRSKDINYVSQFLRVIPRVAAVDVVA